MMDKTEIFFQKHLDKLPFFLRNHTIKELQISEDISETSSIVSFDHIPVYHSEFVECKLSQKPISKLLTFDEQKEF
ncbi:hypothetical protein [Aquimarina sp. AU58]|uniref:hypothetical protein n=1 Tax=Aquimarina sp. AU58 TaxID=1874112 RepID=UPI00135735B5|nr:hypothetical protein [Aquimarina sp. AU58]